MVSDAIREPGQACEEAHRSRIALYSTTYGVRRTGKDTMRSSSSSSCELRGDREEELDRAAAHHGKSESREASEPSQALLRISYWRSALSWATTATSRPR